MANQASLLSDATACFGGLDEGHPQTRTEDSGHDRKEHRKAVVVSAKGLAEHHEFPDLNAFGRIAATQELDGKTSSETRYFALSWTPHPEVLLATVRAHWSIEYALHWQLDVSLREDAARNRNDNAPGSIAVLRRCVLGLVWQDPSKSSISIKLKGAAWDEGFFRSILNGLKEPIPES